MADNVQKGELNAAKALSILHWRLIHSATARNQPRQLLLSSQPPLGLSSLLGTTPSIPLKNVGKFKATFLPQSGGFAFTALVM